MISISTGTIVRSVLVLIFFYLLFVIKDILLVILAAIVIASAVEPGTRWFKRHSIPRLPAVLIVYVLSMLILISSFYFFLLPFLGDAASLLQTLPEYSAALSRSEQGIIGEFSGNFSLTSLVETVNETLADLSTGFFGIIDVIFGGIVSFVLIVVLSFYLAVQEDGVGKFLRIVTPLNKEKYVIDLWSRSKEKIGLWMQGQLLLTAIVAVLVFLGLTLLGVPNALLLGVFAGVMEIIPLFGSFLAAAPAVLIAFLDGGLTLALLTTGLFIIINQFEGQLIYPLVVKKVVGVPPMVSIIALIIGGKLAGFLGILLSVPVAAVLMELLTDLEKNKARESV